MNTLAASQTAELYRDALQDHWVILYCKSQYGKGDLPLTKKTKTFFFSYKKLTILALTCRITRSSLLSFDYESYCTEEPTRNHYSDHRDPEFSRHLFMMVGCCCCCCRSWRLARCCSRQLASPKIRVFKPPVKNLSVNTTNLSSPYKDVCVGGGGECYCIYSLIDDRVLDVTQ